MKFMWVFFMSISTVQAGFDMRFDIARLRGMAGSMAATIEGIEAIQANPAGIAPTSSLSALISHSPGSFGFSELGSSSFSCVVPLKTLPLGASASRFGFPLYYENKVVVNTARSFNTFSLGASVTYYSLSIEGYGSASALGASVGVIARSGKSLRYGLSLHNINRATLGRSTETPPQIFLLGISFLPVESLTLAFDIVRQTPFPPSLHAGFECAILEWITARGGVSQDPSGYAFGFSISQKGLTFGYAADVHGELGITHFVSLKFSRGKP